MDVEIKIKLLKIFILSKTVLKNNRGDHQPKFQKKIDLI